MSAAEREALRERILAEMERLILEARTEDGRIAYVVSREVVKALFNRLPA